MRVILALPHPGHGARGDIEEADGGVVPRAAGEGETAPVRRPHRVPRDELVAAAHDDFLAAGGVDDVHGGVLAARARGHGQPGAVRRPAWRALRVREVGEVGEGSSARRGLGRHHGDGVALTVRNAQGEARTVGGEVEIGERRELRCVGQQVDERPRLGLVAVDVVALRAAVVRREVERTPVRREQRAPAGVAEVADTARFFAVERGEEDLPVAVAVPLHGDGVTVRGHGEGAIVRVERGQGRKALDEAAGHCPPSSWLWSPRARRGAAAAAPAAFPNPIASV